MGINLKNWREIKLGDIAEISRGGSPRPIEKYLTKNPDGLNWLRIGDIENGKKFIYKTTDKILKEGLNKTTVVEDGDFILSNSMSFGRPYIMKTSACIHDGWLALKNISNSIDKSFLYYLLSSEKIQYLFKTLSAGSGVQNLKKETVSSAFVLFPPIEEQNKIASILETWDEYSEKLFEKIDTINKIKKEIIKELLTGHTRLSEFKDQWRSCRLEDVAEIKKGQGLSKEKLCKNGKNKCILYGEIYTRYNEVIEDVISRTDINEGIKSKKNDVLIPASTTTSALDLATATAVLEDDVLLGGDINIVRDKKNYYDGRFLSYYLSHIKKHELACFGQGITIVHLYGKDFKSMEIFLPTVKEQKAIVDIIMLFDKKIKLLKNKKKLIDYQKKYILNNLVTGKIRIPEFQKVK